MNLTYACPLCDEPARTDLSAAHTEIVCPHCHGQIEIPPGAIEKEHVRRCVVCPSGEMFWRSDFPQKLGVAIVVTGFAISCVTWYYHMIVPTFVVLFITAGIDVGLYALLGNVLCCYRCHAQYRGSENDKQHGGFDLETHERYRQQAIRTAQMQPRTSPEVHAQSNQRTPHDTISS